MGVMITGTWNTYKIIKKIVYISIAIKNTIFMTKYYLQCFEITISPWPESLFRQYIVNCFLGLRKLNCISNNPDQERLLG